MVQRVSTVAFEGIEARAVDVQVQIVPGLPAFAIVGLDYRDYVVQDERHMRPAEVDLLIGDPTHAQVGLGWQRSVDFTGLVQRMVEADLAILRQRRQQTMAEGA